MCGEISEFSRRVGGDVYTGKYDATLIEREFAHFKGEHYHLLGFAKMSETEETAVVYQTLYGERGMWVRPAEIFFGDVIHDGVVQSRFRLMK